VPVVEAMLCHDLVLMVDCYNAFLVLFLVSLALVACRVRDMIAVLVAKHKN
jgi:hypothetical protein